MTHVARILPASCCCPTCGAPLPGTSGVAWNSEARTLVFEGQAVLFAKKEADVFDALWRTRRTGGIFGTERFIALAWADDLDGGPQYPSTLHVILQRVRRKLETIGLSVTYANGNPRQSYRIVSVATGESIRS